MRSEREIARAVNRGTRETCPFEHPIECRQVRARQPLPPLRGLLVDAESEAGIAVAELLGDVAGIVAEGIGCASLSRRGTGVIAGQKGRRLPDYLS